MVQTSCGDLFRLDAFNKLSLCKMVALTNCWLRKSSLDKNMCQIWWGNKRQRLTYCSSLTRLYMCLPPVCLLLSLPPLLCSSSLLWGLVERLDSRWQSPTPLPVMNGGWCHLRFDRRPCVHTQRKPEPLGSNCGPAPDFGVHMTSLKWGKLDLCPGWYCLTPHAHRPWEEEIQWNLQGTGQSTKFLRGGESSDWLLEINTDPVIAAGQFKSRSICVNIAKKTLIHSTT